MHPPSGWVHLRLWLRVTGPVSADYPLFARIVGGGGVWGEMIPLSNSALERFPTSSWKIGDFMRVEVDVNLNPTTPPGIYEAMVDFGQGAESSCGPVEIK